MNKIIVIFILSFIQFFTACSSKQPMGTLEATDYAMTCEALKNEINLVRSQWESETNQNTAKNVIGGIVTMGLYSADKEKETILRERAKNLQLIYTIKQAKGECEKLNSEDVKVDNEFIRTSKEIKNTSKEIIE